LNPYHRHLIYTTRNFFGTIKVFRDDSNKVHLLMHGTTLHGVQFMQPGRQREIAAYYAPLNSLFNALDKKYEHLNIAVAGLGVGTLACYARTNDQLTFYEIDPAMISTALNPHYFTYLKVCPP